MMGTWLAKTVVFGRCSLRQTIGNGQWGSGVGCLQWAPGIPCQVVLFFSGQISSHRIIPSSEFSGELLMRFNPKQLRQEFKQ
jgi:hypothetical protein